MNYTGVRKMHEVTMRMSDKSFESLNHFIQYMPDVELVRDDKAIVEDEFKLDIDELVATAKRIKNGDVADFKEMKDVDQLMQDIEEEIKKL